MSIDLNIKDLAKKSLLRLSKDEEEKFEKDLLSILEMISILPELEGDPFSLKKDETLILRKDEIESSIRREKILENANEIEAGCFSVPKIMEE